MSTNNIYQLDFSGQEINTKLNTVNELKDAVEELEKVAWGDGQYGSAWWTTTEQESNSSISVAKLTGPVERTPAIGDLILYASGSVYQVTEVLDENYLAVEKTAINLVGEKPVRGEDYWTKDDQKAIQDENYDYIANQVAVRSQIHPIYVESTDKCVDPTKLYLLPNGYIYAYYGEGLGEPKNQLIASNAGQEANFYINQSLFDGSSTCSCKGGFYTEFLPINWIDWKNQNYIFTIQAPGFWNFGTGQLLPIQNSVWSIKLRKRNGTSKFYYSTYFEGDGANEIPVSTEILEKGTKKTFELNRVRLFGSNTTDDDLPVELQICIRPYTTAITQEDELVNDVIIEFPGENKEAWRNTNIPIIKEADKQEIIEACTPTITTTETEDGSQIIINDQTIDIPKGGPGPAGVSMWASKIPYSGDDLYQSKIFTIEDKEVQIGDLILFKDGQVARIVSLAREEEGEPVYEVTPCGFTLLGPTPQIGEDYWTEDDIEEINLYNEQFIKSQLADKTELKPEFAETIPEDADTTKLYVLSDGYVYAYYTKYIEEKVNQLVGNNVTLNKTFLSSGGLSSTFSGCFASDWIEMKWGNENTYQIRITAPSLVNIYDSGTNAILTFSDDGSAVSKVVQLSEEVVKEGDYNSITINLDVNEIGSKPSHMKISARISDTSLGEGYDITQDVFVECPTLNLADEVADWYNTGHAFLPVKGKDYFTDGDKQEIVDAVLAELQNASGVSF